MALRSLYNELKSLREVPERAIRRGMRKYEAKYMVLGQYSAAPIFHFVFAGIVFVSLGTLTIESCARKHAHQNYCRYCDGTGIQNMNLGSDLSEDSGS